MFDLLSKFLKKEGYDVKRVLHDTLDLEDYAMLIYAPARGWSNSPEGSFRAKDWFGNLKDKKTALLVVQNYDEDRFDGDNNVAMLSDCPLNLRKLSETIKKQLSVATTTLS